MRLLEFATKIKVGFLKRQVIYSSVIICTTLYALLPPSTTKLILLLSIGLTAQMTLTLFVRKFRPALEFAFSRKKMEPIDIPELSELAAKMQIKLPEKPFLITDRKIFALVNIASRKILFWRDLYNRLTSEELHFVGGHELTHIKENHYSKLVLSTLPPLIATTVLLTIIGVPQGLVLLASFASVLLTLNFVSRKLELMADIGGAKNVREEVAISAIKKVYSDVGLKEESDTHPSAQKRIKNLREFYRKSREVS